MGVLRPLSFLGVNFSRFFIAVRVIMVIIQHKCISDVLSRKKQRPSLPVSYPVEIKLVYHSHEVISKLVRPTLIGGLVAQVLVDPLNVFDVEE